MSLEDDIEALLAEADQDTLEKRLTKRRKKIHHAETVFHKGKLMIPETMSVQDAIKALQALDESLNTEVEVKRTFNCFPWDGALALQRVLVDRYGWSPQKPTEFNGFFGKIKHPPKTISVATGPNPEDVAQVPWGNFEIPGTDGGLLRCDANMTDGRFCFALEASVARRHEAEVKALMDQVAREAARHSIYRGKAISIKFFDEDGDLMPMPTIAFLDTSVTPDQLILSRDVEGMVQANLLTPIQRARDCIANGIPLKRGVLLGGDYGTGKTLAAAVAANQAAEHGITYLYVPRADQLRYAISFARQYADPACVVFCEDIDRVMNGERSTDMDDILNIIDGIDGKASNIMVVLTSNFVDKINQAMLRPGRLDAVIEVTAPDAEAVERLLRHYGGDAIDPDEDLSSVGEQLQGQIPAIVAEVVKRAKLVQLALLPSGSLITRLSSEALLSAAKSMTRQLQLLEPKKRPERSDLEYSLGSLVGEVLNSPKFRLVREKSAA